MSDRNINLHEKRMDERLFSIIEDIYRIPIPTGFPVGDVNLYFLDGPEPVLIDTGVMAVETTVILSKALDSIGRNISDISSILLTHIHVDHAANARKYKEMSGARVMAFNRAIRRLSDVQASFKSDNSQYRDFFLRCGFDIDMVMQQQVLTEKMIKRYPSCPGVEPVNDGDLVPIGDGRLLQAFYRPGHSLSDMVFALNDRKILFTGDHVLPHITPNPTIEPAEPGETHRPKSLIKYRKSLAATRAMPVTLACPGHGLPFDNLAQRCEQILDLQVERAEKVYSIIYEHGPVTYRDLGVKLFGEVHLWDIYLSISEVVGACDLLEEQGMVVIETNGPVDLVHIA